MNVKKRFIYRDFEIEIENHRYRIPPILSRCYRDSCHSGKDLQNDVLRAQSQLAKPFEGTQ